MLGVGVVGFGYWGPKLARVVAASDGCRLVGICEPGPASATARHLHCDVECARDFATFLTNPDIEAVALATPAETHVPLATAALRAGKHVLCEKPLALSVDDVDGLCLEAAANDRTLMVDHVYVFSPPVVAVAGLLDDGLRESPARYRSVRVNVDPIPAVGAVFDLLVHDAAILDRWRGASPVAVRAAPGSGELIDVEWTYGDGFEAAITVGRAAAKRRFVEVGGDGWTLVFDDDEPVEKLRLATDDTDADRLVPYRPDEPLACAVDHFVGCVRGTTVPLADGAAARRVVGVLEAAARSLAHGEVVNVALEPVP